MCCITEFSALLIFKKDREYYTSIHVAVVVKATQKEN